MDGLPVTIRLLDPPLHEFLPDPDELPEGRERDRARSLQEVNPMLGTRGVRLGILYPGDLRDAGPRDRPRGQGACASARARCRTSR